MRSAAVPSSGFVQDPCNEGQHPGGGEAQVANHEVGCVQALQEPSSHPATANNCNSLINQQPRAMLLNSAMSVGCTESVECRHVQFSWHE